MSSSVPDSKRTPSTQIDRSNTPRGNYGDALIDKLVDEMIRRWQDGDQVQTEEFLNRHPDLWHQPESAIELVYEEICLRKKQDQFDFAMPVLERFPQWRKRLDIMLEFHCLLETPPPQFPQVGETIAGYHLLQQLGRGASGRVFLARQSDLADRPVVVKFTAHRGEDREYLNLARLQHTHIVPLFAVHVDPVRHLRLLCMPYYGGVTLERLLDSLPNCPLKQCRDEDLKQALRKSGIGVSGSIEPLLCRLSYVQGICWIGGMLGRCPGIRSRRRSFAPRRESFQRPHWSRRPANAPGLSSGTSAHSARWSRA